MTTKSRWQTFLHQPVLGVKVYWSWEQDIKQDRVYFPQDLEIEFESGEKVIISASQYDKDRDTLLDHSNEVTVIFDKNVAQQYHVGPFGGDRGWTTTWEGTPEEFERMMREGGPPLTPPTS